MIFHIIIILAWIPLSYYIAYISRDELIVGRTWFIIIGIVSFFVGVGSLLYEIQAGAYCAIISIMLTSISYIKSFDKKWAQIK